MALSQYFSRHSITGFFVSALLHGLLFYFFYLSLGHLQLANEASERSVAASLSMFENEQLDDQQDQKQPSQAQDSLNGQTSSERQQSQQAKRNYQSLITSFNLDVSDQQIATELGALDSLTSQYLMVLRNKIDKRIYDKVFADNISSEGGITEVAFDIDRLGRISQVQITRSSGSEVFDQAVLDSIREIGRYKPFPIGVDREQFRMGYGFKTLD